MRRQPTRSGETRDRVASNALAGGAASGDDERVVRMSDILYNYSCDGDGDVHAAMQFVMLMTMLVMLVFGTGHYGRHLVDFSSLHCSTANVSLSEGAYLVAGSSWFCL